MAEAPQDARRSELTAVILAAGEGRRAGQFKPLVPLAGRTALERVLDAAASVCTHIRVVGGARFDELAAHLAARGSRVELLRNDGWAAGGMFSSVQIGLRGLAGPAFVHPVDVPGPGPAVYRRLAEAAAAQPSAVLRPTHAGRPGHPVLLDARTVARIGEADPRRTLRAVLADLPRRDVPVDDALVLQDFDTPAELAALARRLAARDVSEE